MLWEGGLFPYANGKLPMCVGRTLEGRAETFTMIRAEFPRLHFLMIWKLKCVHVQICYVSCPEIAKSLQSPFAGVKRFSSFSLLFRLSHFLTLPSATSLPPYLRHVFTKKRQPRCKGCLEHGQSLSACGVLALCVCLHSLFRVDAPLITPLLWR